MSTKVPKSVAICKTCHRHVNCTFTLLQLTKMGGSSLPLGWQTPTSTRRYYNLMILNSMSRRVNSLVMSLNEITLRKSVDTTKSTQRCPHSCSLSPPIGAYVTLDEEVRDREAADLSYIHTEKGLTHLIMRSMSCACTRTRSEHRTCRM